MESYIYLLTHVIYYTINGVFKKLINQR